MRRIIIGGILTIGSFWFVFSTERAGEILQELERPTKSIEIPQKPEIFIQYQKKRKKLKGKQKFFVKNIQVKGITVLPKKEIEKLVKKYEGKEISLDELQELADKITQLYRKKGYITSFAYIPPQTIRKGKVVIKVLEAKLGKVYVKGNQRHSKEFIKKHFKGLEGKPLNIKDLERRILILDEYPFVNVKSILSAGKEPFSSDATISVEEERPLRLFINYNNWGSKITSKNRILIGFQTGFLIREGDFLDLKFLTGLDKVNTDKLRYVRAEYKIPINYSGTKAGIYYTNSAYQAGQEFKILGLEGKADVIGIFVEHPLVLQRQRELRIKGEFAYKDIYEYILDNRKSKDAIRSVKVSLSYGFSDFLVGYNYWEVSFTQGIKGIFGGNGDFNPKASRFGAQGDFSKINFSITRIQALPYGINLYGIVQGQWSDDKLFSAEQFILGGVGSVRGFEPAQVSGDKGINVNVEMEIPMVPEQYLKTGFFRKLSAVLFWDWGGVFRNNPLPGEYGSQYLTSIGGGLRVKTQKHFFLSVDYAVPQRNDTFETGLSKVYVSADLKF